MTFIIRINVEVQYVTEHLLPSATHRMWVSVQPQLTYMETVDWIHVLNTAAYYNSNYEIINWVPHVLYSINLLSLPCDILPEFFFFFFFFFAENFDFFFKFF